MFLRLICKSELAQLLLITVWGFIWVKASENPHCPAKSNQRMDEYNGDSEVFKCATSMQCGAAIVSTSSSM